MSKPLRVLVLSSTYPRWAGDPEPGFVHELSKRLAADFSVTVLAPHATGALRTEVMDGVEVRRYRYAPDYLESLVVNGGIVSNVKKSPWKWLLVPLFLSAQMFATWRTVIRLQPDVIHAHWLIPQGLLLSLLVRAGLVKTPFIVTSHGADLFTLKGALFLSLKRLVLGSAAAVTVVGNAMRDEIGKLGLPNVRVRVAPMGVDMFDRFSPSQDIPRSANQLLFVGRLVEKKGLRHLLAIMPGLLMRHPGLHLTVVGRGPEEAPLRQQVEAMGLQHCVEFVGAKPQAELPDLYRSATLFVAPFVEAASGDQEGLGLVTVEAVACGCPALVGAVAAVRDVPVKSVDVRNHELFMTTILQILADPQAAAALALQQRDACIQKFDWSEVAQGYAQLIRECAEDAAG
jgi:glycosyltransferase involved in cell wall biosynthesis